MIKTLNRFGEVDFNKNEALYTIPLLRLDTEEVEIIEENYRQKIKELDYQDVFIYANHISAIRDRLQMSFDLTGAIDFNHLHKLDFKEILPYLQSIVEISKVDVVVLWEKNNFVIDLEEKRVKALLFDFEGFNIYKKDEKLDGLKELILLSLTKLNKILGKPKRADFIIQSDRVIQFAEDVLRATSIYEIERIITSYVNEIEYEELRIQEELEERKRNSKAALMLSKFKKEKKKINAEEKIKEELNNKFEGKKDKDVSERSLFDKITSPKGMIGVIVAVFIGATIYIVGDFDNKTEASDEKTFEIEMKNKDKVLESYRLYMTGDEDNIKTAYSTLDNIGYENLSKKDKEVLINWYLEQEQYTKALSTNVDSAYKIGDKLLAEENGLEQLEQLSNSFKDNSVLIYDIASLQNQYQIMIENNNIKFNDKRAKKMIEAYIMTNQIDEMYEFINGVKESDESSYENLSVYADQLTDRYIEKKNLSDELKTLNEELNQEKEKYEKEKDKKKKEELKKSVENKEKSIGSLKEKIESINKYIQEN